MAPEYPDPTVLTLETFHIPGKGDFGCWEHWYEVAPLRLGLRFGHPKPIAESVRDAEAYASIRRIKIRHKGT